MRPRIGRIWRGQVASDGCGGVAIPRNDAILAIGPSCYTMGSHEAPSRLQYHLAPFEQVQAA